MLSLNPCKTVCTLFLLYAAAAIAAPAQTFTNLYTFEANGTAFPHGAYPFGTLVQGLDGNLWGTTLGGSGGGKCNSGCGTIFKITPDGTLTMVHSFHNTDGAYPYAGLVLATNGNFYGSTFGAFQNVATAPSFFFEITPEGALTNLQSGGSLAALMQDTSDGNLYGTIPGTGFPGNAGSVFSLTTGGTMMTTLHSFCNVKTCGGISGGSYPTAPLVQGTNGVLYGTTAAGGTADPSCVAGVFQAGGCGTVFAIGTKGSLSILHKFGGRNGPDGSVPRGGLVLGNDGNFYGTTEYGGTGVGTVFKITPTGTLTTLHSFSPAEGRYPNAGLALGTDGNFYGTTSGIGSDYGSVFQITPDGTLTTLHTFDKTDDGAYPNGGLVQATDGNFYGTTSGLTGIQLYGTVFGTVFKLSMGIAPFVKTVPTAAYPGTTIFILGTDLTGATSVTFNGKAATFTIVSATEITTTVPSGSTTGTVEVVTPGGTLSSNVPFRVF